MQAADGKMDATMATRASSASSGSIAWRQPDNEKCTRRKSACTWRDFKENA